MSEGVSLRLERIERLLQELRYEVTRGMMEREIEEEIGFRFYVPLSKSINNGVVFCEFRTRPIPAHSMDSRDAEPRLNLVT